MCRVLKVSRSCYYSWRQQKPSSHQVEDEALENLIIDIFVNSQCAYGSHRIRKEMQDKGFQISRRRVRKLMKIHTLNCKTKRKFKATTDSNHSNPVAPNILNRQFNVDAPDKAYVGDITYVSTEEGWLYLAVVIDLFSRQVVGWSMNRRMKAQLVNDALIMALWKRKPPRGLIWHTDRGSQYASDSHRELIDDHGLIQSMSRKGNCWDNSVAESFFKTLKSELIYNYRLKTTDEERKIIFEYIESFYNQERLHSANEYLSPMEYKKVF